MTSPLTGLPDYESGIVLRRHGVELRGFPVISDATPTSNLRVPGGRRWSVA
jgi:hypothetical protein